MSLKCVRGLALALLVAIQPAASEPYQWPKSTPKSVLASSDRVVGEVIEGASLQGGLIDVRFGQLSVDVAGVGQILDWDAKTLFTLNGTTTKASELASLVLKGQALKVAVRYNPESGYVGWLDALSSEPQAAIYLELEPYLGPAMEAGQELKITIPRFEARRLDLDSATLFAPGMTHKLEMTGEGSLHGTLPLLQGWNWFEIPLYVRNNQGTAWRGRKISVSSNGPRIVSYGPEETLAVESKVSCWIDLANRGEYLSLTESQFEVSQGGKLSRPAFSNGRLHFELEVDGPGTYWIEARVVDQLDRASLVKWPVSVGF